MRLLLLPLLCAIFPALGVHICFAVAATGGHIDWCNPYWANCVSISATGRAAPEAFIFRAVMIPTAILMMLYWLLCFQWMQALESHWKRLNCTMLWLGVIAGLGLIAYTVVLGEVGRAYYMQRRIGVVLFFSMTYIAQLILVGQLRQLEQGGRVRLGGVLRLLWGLTHLILLTGLFSVVLGVVYSEYNLIEDAFEWVLSLMLQFHFLLVAVIWRRRDLRSDLNALQ